MRNFLRAVPFALLLTGMIPHSSIAQVPPVRERIGGRIGYVDTYSELHGHYGAGWNATIYFTEKLYKVIFLDIQIGAIYMGDLLKPDVIESIFGEADSEMRLLYASVGPVFTFPIGESLHWYTGASFGVYSTSVVFVTAFPSQSGDFSDQHLGGNASLGLLLRFTATWNLDLNLTVHHFRTSTDSADLFYFFTGRGAEDPFLLQAAVGIAIDLR